jgi:hypothetical protein
LNRNGWKARAPLAVAVAWLLLASAPPVRADTILFVGNSFTFGARSPVWKYRADTVADLNGTGYGGVPALFKLFTKEAGLDYAVSEETVGGKDLKFHLDERRALIDRAFDHVVLQSYSTLDEAHPGDPTGLIAATPPLAALFHARNPRVDIRMMATWSRADLTYPETGHWHGKPIDAMEKDVKAGYDQAAAASSFIAGVIPVGGAWARAIRIGFATANPYTATPAGQVDLWAWDNYHASAYGYYIEALMVFGAVTGKDPRSLGEKEGAAAELGISPGQAAAMQQIAHDELAAAAGR